MAAVASPPFSSGPLPISSWPRAKGCNFDARWKGKERIGVKEGVQRGEGGRRARKRESSIYNAFASLQGPQPVEAVNVACISYETPPPPGYSSQCQSWSFVRLIIPTLTKLTRMNRENLSSLLSPLSFLFPLFSVVFLYRVSVVRTRLS